MVASSRGILAIGLSVAGLAYLVAPTLGQGQQQDGAVRKTASPTPATPPDPVAPVIGTVDIELVFKSYDKVKVSNKEYSAALLARKNELMKIMAEAQEEAQMLVEVRARHRRLQEAREPRDRAQGAARGRPRAGRARVRPAPGRGDGHALQRNPGDGQEDRPVAQDELRRQGIEPADHGDRSQLGDGGDFQHDGLCRPAQRHHQRRDLQPQSVLQGDAGPAAKAAAGAARPTGQRAPPAGGGN